MTKPSLGQSPVSPYAKKGLLQRFLDGLEVIGNKLPHPFLLFIFMSLLVYIISYFIAGVSVNVPNAAGGVTPVTGVNLLNRAGFYYMLENMVRNFVNFPPLGLILTMTIAISVAEEAGLLRAMMKNVVTKVPTWAVTATIIFVGINANLASDAGMVFMPMLGAAVFAGMKRNPIIGIAAGFAAASGGFTANVFIAGTDALLAGITERAAAIIPAAAKAPTHPLINYYFLAAATFFLTPVLTWVTERIIAPRVGDEVDAGAVAASSETLPTAEERKGLKYAGYTILAFLAVMLILTVPAEGLLRNQTDFTLLPRSPFMTGIVPLIFALFLSVGLAYGYGAGSIKNHHDVARFMNKGIRDVSVFLVVAFFAAQFIALFQVTNLATIVAVTGADSLKSIGLTGLPLLVMVSIFVAFVNLFLISGSAKWAILAPVIVPMLALLGFSPALSQLVYRIGDSSTNIITPLNPFMPMVLAMVQQYRKKSGMGTVISLMIPYSFFIFTTLILCLLLWITLGLPLGPGVGLTL
jgi:aminobenzoyl-glutamate transport protein